jgi:predicted RNase H-like HicB family nuclease
MDMHYTMMIYWSDEDQVYLVSVPKLAEFHIMNWNALTHGNTYEEAARMGTEAIECAITDEMCMIDNGSHHGSSGLEVLLEDDMITQALGE